MNDVNSFDKYSIEQLKKIRESLEKNQKSKLSISKDSISKPNINILDKFTSLDELLIETMRRLNALIDEQEETNRQMRINNRLLLALYVEEAEDGTMVARTPNGIDTSAILREISEDEGRTTIIHSIPNFSGNKKVFELNNSGFAIEIMFKSSTSSTDNKDYSVRVLADDNIIYQDSFASFESRNYFETDMTCYTDDDENYYYLQFKNVSFKNIFIVEIFESNAIFEQVYIKYLEG